MGFTTAQNGNKIFDSSLTQGLYIKGIPTTTQNGTSLGIFSSANETTTINQMVMTEKFNGTQSSYIIMK